MHVGIRAEFAVAAVGLGVDDQLDRRRLIRIDPATNRVSARIKLKGNYPLGITYGAGSIWVANRYSGSVTRVNPRTNKAAKQEDQGRLLSVCARLRFREHLGLERVERHGQPDQSEEEQGREDDPRRGRPEWPGERIRVDLGDGLPARARDSDRPRQEQGHGETRPRPCRLDHADGGRPLDLEREQQRLPARSAGAPDHGHRPGRAPTRSPPP